MSDSVLDKIKRIFGGGPKVVPFSADNYSVREIYRPDYKILADSVLQRIEFNSVMDIGCANGFVLTYFHEAGKKINGIELSADAVAFLPQHIRSNVQIGDFSEASGSYDLVSCIEVAEHIPPHESQRLVDKISSMALDTIYFTAAPPGQPGHGHINCRPHSDWIKMFAKQGWKLDEGLTADIRSDIAGIKEAVWLVGNTLMFRKAI